MDEEMKLVLAIVLSVIIIAITVNRNKEVRDYDAENRQRVEQIKYCHDNGLMASDNNGKITCDIHPLDCNIED